MSCPATTSACKDFEETRPLVFDFTTALGDDSIESMVVTATVISGTDEDADLLLDGSPSLNLAETIVTQWLTGGLINVTYGVRCVVVTGDGRELVGAKNIVVVRR
jgi:hypothetical protein